ncbi:MAG: hypothetical protein QM764_10990 [Chitinophagaceae bacterium]
MRTIIVILLILPFTGFCQLKSYIIGVKGDTLNRVDNNGKKQGPWVSHFDELRGEPGFEEEGYYLNDRKEGTWRKYSLQGDLTAMENFRWGNKDGKNVYFTNTSQLLREESWKAVNPDNPYDTIPIYDLNDPTKIVDHKVIKVDGYTLKHGLWTYYDPMTGKIEKTEKWYHDKPATENEDGELAPIDVANTSTAKSDTAKKYPKPQAILDYEKKNGKKKIKVRDGATGY